MVRLCALARARISSRLARQLDPEDIVLSAYRSFFVAAQNGRLKEIADGDLWPLLVTIVVRKITAQARRSQTQRRDVSREQSLDDLPSEVLRDTDPTPAHAAMIDDELQSFLAKLNDDDREIAVRSLQGSTSSEIATALDCSERTIRRALIRIQESCLERASNAGPLVLGPLVTTATVRHIVSPLDPSPSHQYSDLLLHSQIGQGGFGKVYRATERATGADVAVKFLRRHWWLNPAAAHAIRREYAILCQLQHPHIVRAWGWGETPRGAVFLVMERLTGKTLVSQLQEYPADTRVLCMWLLQVAQALVFAHSHGLVHGDLKPDNIILADEGLVKVLDFGMSRWMIEQECEPPRGGTAGYLSPEQISPAFGPITARSDVYAWGALAYAVLAGRPPVVGRDLPSALATVLSAQPIVWPDDIPPSPLRQLATRCLAKDPLQRLGTMDDIVCQLQRML